MRVSVGPGARPGLCEVQQAGFGDPVPKIGMTGECGNRAHIDDAAASPRLHGRRRSRNERGRSFEVHGQDLAPVRIRDGVNRIAMEHAGVIDQGVDVTDGSDQRRNLRRARQIECDTFAEDLGSEFPVERKHALTRRRKAACRRQSDSPSSAGYESSFHSLLPRASSGVLRLSARIKARTPSYLQGLRSARPHSATNVSGSNSHRSYGPLRG